MEVGCRGETPLALAGEDARAAGRNAGELGMVGVAEIGWTGRLAR